MNDSQTSQWIEAIIEENFKPCNLDERARGAVRSLLTKYNERLVRDSLHKAVRQAKGLARQEDRSICDYWRSAFQNCPRCRDDIKKFTIFRDNFKWCSFRCAQCP